MKKWQIGSIIAISTVVGSLSSAVLWNGMAHGEWDLPGLNQQVQHLTEVSTNHEARITNLESQVNTPAGQPTPTPEVVTRVITEAAPTATPTVAPQATPTPIPTPMPTPFVPSVRVLGVTHQYGQLGFTCEWQTSPTGATVSQYSQPDHGQDPVCPTTPQ